MIRSGLDIKMFVREMERIHRERGLSIFPARVRAWEKLGQVFDRELRRERDDQRPWPVFCGALGIGKTTGAEVACRMLPPGVGALVIVRTTRIPHG